MHLCLYSMQHQCRTTLGKGHTASLTLTDILSRLVCLPVSVAPVGADQASYLFRAHLSPTGWALEVGIHLQREHFAGARPTMRPCACMLHCSYKQQRSVTLNHKTIHCVLREPKGDQCAKTVQRVNTSAGTRSRRQ